MITDFRADIDVHAIAYKPDWQVVFDKTYHGEGFTQGAKMFFGGAFAMKSAIRQSSLDAYKKIFVQLRPALAAALEGQSEVTPCPLGIATATCKL